jgi:hypothetical protein
MAKHGAPFKMTGHTLPGPNQSPMKQDEKDDQMNMSGQARSLYGAVNKLERLSGKKITYKDAWKSMSESERKNHGSFENFSTKAAKFTKENPDYKHGTDKYREYQGYF